MLAQWSHACTQPGKATLLGMPFGSAKGMAGDTAGMYKLAKIPCMNVSGF